MSDYYAIMRRLFYLLEMSINELLIVGVDFSHGRPVRQARAVACLHRCLIIIGSIQVSLLLLMLVFKALVHKSFQSVDVIFSVFKPGIVVCATVNLVVLFEGSTGSSIMQFFGMMRGHDFVICANDEKYRDANIGNPFH